MYLIPTNARRSGVRHSLIIAEKSAWKGEFFSQTTRRGNRLPLAAIISRSPCPPRVNRKGGCGPIRFGTEDQDKNLAEPYNARGKRAISKQSRPGDRAACFAEIHRPRRPCAWSMPSTDHPRAMDWSGSAHDPRPVVTAAWRSCGYLESKTRCGGRNGLAKWMCPTSNFRNPSRNFSLVKSH